MTAADRAGVFVHPAGLCESDDVGAGTRVWAFAHVLPGARVGRDCNICDGAFVENGAVLGDRVTVKNGTLVFAASPARTRCFLGPNVLFTNDLRPRAHVRKDAAELGLRPRCAGARRSAPAPWWSAESRSASTRSPRRVPS